MIKLYWRVRDFILCTILRRKRKLCGKWTVETTPYMHSCHGLDVEEHLISAITTEINKERNDE